MHPPLNAYSKLHAGAVFKLDADHTDVVDG